MSVLTYTVIQPSISDLLSVAVCIVITTSMTLYSMSPDVRGRWRKPLSDPIALWVCRFTCPYMVLWLWEAVVLTVRLGPIGVVNSPWNAN